MSFPATMRLGAAFAGAGAGTARPAAVRAR